MNIDGPQRQLVVLGAGVIGLTIGYLAATDPDFSFKVTIIARDMPEDMDSQAWASPFAGANWSPMPAGGIDQRVYNWERVSFNKLWDMVPTGLVKKLPSRIYSKQAGNPAKLWWKELVREFRELDQSEIPEPYRFGVEFYTISVNPQEYLVWLKSELSSRNVIFERRQVRSLEELRHLVGTQGILVNASSLGSRSIIGVEDTKLYPIRGQTILVQSPGVHECLSSWGDDHPTQGGVTYIIPRPGATYPNTALLGGTFQPGNWDTSLDMGTAQHIFESCAQLAPSLKDSNETKILRHQVGLRPAREGGARLEVEIVEFPLIRTHNLAPWSLAASESGSMRVVHAYGFGGGGYQASWGAAADVLTLVKSLSLTSPA
ncbi:FAD dependent oxidoreductase [Paxillus ammoniavirescens]|nr:FAD dependent oxidoreductase [Paxillus ammoniavirescens]